MSYTYTSFAANSPSQPQLPYMTVGTVVDTNDPLQMGRARIICPTLGESYDTRIEDVPWAVYVSPFAGSTSVGTKGPGLQTTQGPVAYGFWSIPKVRSQVIVSFVDGDPNLRIYIGGAYDLGEPHTMPHGRWMMDDHPALEKAPGDTDVYGPYSSNEKLIRPLADNIRKAFSNKTNSPEWKTRAADFTASALDISAVSTSSSNVADDKDVTVGDWINRQGYQINRQSLESGDYDNMVYCWTSPGFHSVSMDDRQENCRMRFRTTSGNQIILDDTNERIYIMTAEGNNWIEMDQSGNIEMYTSGKFSVRAEGDVNLTSDKTVRILGKEGVHIKSDKDVRIESIDNTEVRVGDTYTLTASNNIEVRSTNHKILTSEALKVRSGSDISLNANGNCSVFGTISFIASRKSMHIRSGSILRQSPTIPGPSSPPPNLTDPEIAEPAFLTNRVPMHEPWARASSVGDFDQTQDLTDPGRMDNNKAIFRGKYWRR